MGWLTRLFRGSAPRPAAAASARPSLEPLEDRQLLTRASATVADLLFRSTEKQAVFVNHEYVTFLRRPVDAAGLALWTTRMSNGEKPESVEAHIVASREYLIRHGDTSRGWITGLYVDLLGRVPDAAGIQHWVVKLNLGEDPYFIALAFTAGAERQSQVIRGAYQAFLGRQPEAGAVNFWLDQFMTHNQNRFDLGKAIVGGDEYYQRYGNNDRDFIIIAYVQNLARHPSPGELSDWLVFMSRIR